MEKCNMFQTVVTFIQQLYGTQGQIPLHEPRFSEKEKTYLNACIDSGFVSSVGEFVDQLEEAMARYCGAQYAVATSSGTAALHLALLLAKVGPGDAVITQPLTFVATCNAIDYCGASPIFVDVDADTLGLSPHALSHFLQHHAQVINRRCFHRQSGKEIKACVPMHTLGHPCKIDQIRSICEAHHMALIEDAAESLGSFHNGQHTGTFGQMGILSFNGNKIITAGGGGCLLTNDGDLAQRAKALSTTAKQPHAWEYVHDQVAYNYRMPNLNAALLLAQLDNLPTFVDSKRALAKRYHDFFRDSEFSSIHEPANSQSNYWLNAILLRDREQRDAFLKMSYDHGIMTRPLWQLMPQLPMFSAASCGPLKQAESLVQRVVTLPSSVLPS
jgi:perosamine synthetase